MDITISHEQGRVPVAVLHIKGDVDAKTQEQLRKQAKEAIEAGASNMVLDLAAVSYVSSAGLGAIHYIFTLLRTNAPSESDAAMNKGLRDGTFKSPHLKLLDPTPAVSQVLSTAGMDMYLEVHRNLQDAVASF